MLGNTREARPQRRARQCDTIAESQPLRTLDATERIRGSGAPQTYARWLPKRKAATDQQDITRPRRTKKFGTLVPAQPGHEGPDRPQAQPRTGGRETPSTSRGSSPSTSRIAPSGTWIGTYDDQDRLLTYGPYTYIYTANGELRTKTTGGQPTTYTYDVRGNLVRVELPDGTLIEYLIDGYDRRVGKKRNGVLEKQWLYKDQLRIAAELDGAGNLVSRFVYASRENVPDFVIRGGVTYRVFSDHLGSPRVAVNVANASDRPLELEYAAFGAVTGTGAAWMPQGFAGGVYDADTGLVRFGARDFDPVVGRWVCKDSVRFRSGDSPNLYLYANGDPINFFDPNGRQTIPMPIPWGPLGGALGGAAAGAAVGGIPGALIGACIGALVLTTGDTPREDEDTGIWEKCFGGDPIPGPGSMFTCEYLCPSGRNETHVSPTDDCPPYIHRRVR